MYKTFINMRSAVYVLIVILIISSSCVSKKTDIDDAASVFEINADTLILPNENHFKHNRQFIMVEIMRKSTGASMTQNLSFSL